MEKQLMSTPLLDHLDGATMCVDLLLLPVKPEDLDDADLDAQLKKLVYIYMEEPLAHTGETGEGRGRATSCVRTRMHKYADLAIELAKLLNRKGKARHGGQMEALALFQDFHRWHVGELPSAHLKPYVEHTTSRPFHRARATRGGGGGGGGGIGVGGGGDNGGGGGNGGNRRRGGNGGGDTRGRGGIDGGIAAAGEEEGDHVDRTCATGGGRNRDRDRRGGKEEDAIAAAAEERGEGDVERTCATGGVGRGRRKCGGGGGRGGDIGSERGGDGGGGGGDGSAAAGGGGGEDGEEEEVDVEVLPIDATTETTTTGPVINLSTGEGSGGMEEENVAERPRVCMKQEEHVSPTHVDASGGEMEAMPGAICSNAGRHLTITPRLRPHVPDRFFAPQAPSSSLRGRTAILSATDRPQLRPKPSQSVAGHHRQPARGARGPARHGGKRKKFSPQTTIVPQRLKDAYIGWATSGVSRITEGSAMDILDSVTIALSYMAVEGWENKLSANIKDSDVIDIERTLDAFLQGRAPKPVKEYLLRRNACDRVPKDLRRLREDINDFLKFLSAEASLHARQTHKPPPATAPLCGCCELDPHTGDDFLEWATCRTPQRPAVVDEHAQAALRNVEQLISRIPAAPVGARVVYKKNALPIWRRHRRVVEPLLVSDETMRESWKLFLCFLDAGQSDMPSEPSFFDQASSDDSNEGQDHAVVGSMGAGGAAAKKGTARSLTAATIGLFRSFKRAGHTPSSSSPSPTDAGAAVDPPCPAFPTDDSDCDADIYGVPPEMMEDINLPTNNKPVVPYPQGPSEWLDAASQVVADIAHDLGTIRQLRQQTLDVRTSTLNMQAHLNTLLDGLHAHDAAAARARARLAAIGMCCDFL